MGIATGQNGYDNPEDILRDADTALYRAKERYEVFNKDMRARAIARLELENDLRKVIERRQLYLDYQPIVSLKTDEIEAFEALVRWEHPECGMISPADFIPVAEETGLIVPVGERVLREACYQTQVWRDRFPIHRKLSVSANLSGKQLVENEFIVRLDGILEETGIDPQFLTLEITESVMLDGHRVDNGATDPVQSPQH